MVGAVVVVFCQGPVKDRAPFIGCNTHNGCVVTVGLRWQMQKFRKRGVAWTGGLKNSIVYLVSDDKSSVADCFQSYDSASIVLQK